MRDPTSYSPLAVRTCSPNLWSAIFTIPANPLKCHCHARNLKTVISLNHVLQYCIPLYFRTLRSWLTLPCAISLFYMHITIKKCILFWAFGAPAPLFAHSRLLGASAASVSKVLPSSDNDFSSPSSHSAHSNWGSHSHGLGHGVIHVYPGNNRHVEISRPLDPDVQASRVKRRGARRLRDCGLTSLA